MKFFDPAVKFSHYEYNKDLSDREITDKICMVEFFNSQTRDPDVDDPSISLRWIVKIFSDEGIVLDVVGEDMYPVYDFPKIKIEDMLIVMKRSLQDFKRRLCSRSGTEFKFEIPVDESVAAKFLEELAHQMKPDRA